MKLSTRGRYGVRAMMELAVDYPKNPQPLKKLALSQGISAKYLEQLLIPLKGAGLVNSVRGARGGYLLAQPPDQINLYDIVKVLEGPIAFVDCVDSEFFCPRRDQCVIQYTWAEMSKLVSSFLCGITLSNLLEKQAALPA